MSYFLKWNGLILSIWIPNNDVKEIGMKKTFFEQIFYCHLVLTLLLIIILATFTLNYLHREQYNYLIKQTTLLWLHLSKNIENITDTLNSPELNEQVCTLSYLLNASIFIYDNQDRIIVRYHKGELDDTEYQHSKIEDQIKREIKTIAIPENGKHFTLYNFFISSFPIYYRAKINGYFVVIQERDVVLSSWNVFLHKLIYLILFVLLFTLVFFIIYTHKLITPIKHLTKVASLININNLDIPIIMSEENEIGELTNQFRQMSLNLKNSYHELNSKKEILISIINSINQAIWIVDKNAVITMANKNFERLINEEDCSGIYFYELLRNHDIIKIYQDASNSKENITREIELSDSIYLCTASYLQINDNVIMTLIDISNLKAVEDFKKDLISNVSHELKTPLTAIKGFVETLFEEASNEQRKYLDIVSINTERLITIVNDLLTLSKLEQSNQIIKQEINLKNFVNKFDVLFTDSLKKQNMSITYLIPDDLPTLFADEFMLEQVFINLIDNAIKYAGKGEITISIEYDHNQFIFKIKDTGIGIAPKDQTRIFERFYVADKSRSKRIGGTGLGLAIVKHIIQLHNGRISVESEIGKGTIFTIELV